MPSTERVQPRALLSVSDKQGLAPLAARLAAAGYQLVSTGGTFKALQAAGIPVTYVSEITGFPEILDGRVKTLHPAVHGGILFRRDVAQHALQLADNGIVPVDVVVVNLYPFAETIAKAGVTEPEAIEQIDIGGPAMLRAAAKNFRDVTVVVRPADYDRVADAIEQGTNSVELRRELALEAFAHTAAYDSAIASYLGAQCAPEALIPQRLFVPLEQDAALRYGENPHQAAALFRATSAPTFGGARFMQGKELSYNNLLDADAALEAVREHDEPAVVIVKHTNPCGVGRGATIEEAYDRALAADPVSAFGGIVASNREVSPALAKRLAELFLEVVIAPSFAAEALETLGAKKALRLLAVDTTPQSQLRLRTTAFGTLAQTLDPRVDADFEQWEVVSTRQPTDDEVTALRFLWRVCKHVKSNAIVVGGPTSTAGVGAGQMSRVESVRIAISKAAGQQPLALASDAFFPFRDGVDVAAAGGVTAIIQPGGSKRDQEVIDAANEHGIAMVLVGRRHFRH